MQELELIKQNIDLQPNQLKQESTLGSLLNHSISLDPLHNLQSTSTSTTGKKVDNRFQASLERQRNLLLNMEQQLIFPQQLVVSELVTTTDDEKGVMDIVDNNNNTMLFNTSNRQLIGSLPGINELRNSRTSTNYNADNLLLNSGDKKVSRSNSMNILFNQTNGQFSEFVGHFDDEEDYSRLSHSNTLYDSYELNQSIKMEDACFQDDKLVDFKTGPTLAELSIDDDMMDNLPTVCVDPNSVLCPSMPLTTNGFLMGINNYTIGLTSTNCSSSTTTQADSNRGLVVCDDRFSLNHLNSSTSTNQTGSKNGFNRCSTNELTNNNGGGGSSSGGKQSYNTRKRGRNKSEGDKVSRARQNNNTNQSSSNKLSETNKVLCKLLNEKNDSLNNLNSIYLVNPNSIQTGQSIPSTSSFQTTTICVSSLTAPSNTQLSPNNSLSNKPISNDQLNNLLLNQLQSNLNSQQLQQQAKCGLQANLRLNQPASRNRNSSISTEHSFSSSHDEGFISQAEEDSDEKDLDSQMICDQKILTGNKQAAKAKRKRARKDTDKEMIGKNEQDTGINRNMKKIKLEDSKASTSLAGFTSTLSTVNEELMVNVPSTSKVKEEKVATKGRVNYKITKEKPIPQTPTDLQQNSFKFNDTKLDKPSLDEKVEDEESSDDEDDESFYGDYDAHDLLGATTSDDQQNKWSLNMGRSRKNSAQRYFWQYNVQSKGPKSSKLTSTINESCLEGDIPASCSTLGSDLEPLDPVFSPNCQIEGVKHAGKARRGDGNDLTPNPRKLLLIGLELKKLSKIINDLTPVAEVPVNNKSNSRKEKNKLASRACRLKKKAQHEANKIKLNGLSIEYKKLSAVISEFKKVQEKVCEQGLNRENRKLIDQLNGIIKEKGPITRIAGKSSEFVNSVLDSVSSGNNSGGLEKL